MGQTSGCEAAIHVLDNLFDKDRKATLLNVQRICPSFAPILVNTYRSEPSLFIEGETIPSCEGTTQGDVLAMAMYAIDTLPLILQLQHEAEHIWYADDSAAGGTIDRLRNWWDKLWKLGPSFGYYINPSKSLLVIKEHYTEKAKSTFDSTGIEITSTGGRYLGSAIGNNSFKEVLIRKKVGQWTSELERLADAATSQPQAAYSALTHSMKHRWSFLIRTTQDTSDLLQSIEDTIRQKVLPAITGKRAISESDRKLFSLPVNLGGLGIPILPHVARCELSNSVAITEPLINAILKQTTENPAETKAQQKEIQKRIREGNRQLKEEEMKATLGQLNNTTRKATSLAQEKGASAWLGTLPIEEHGFVLHKGASGMH